MDHEEANKLEQEFFDTFSNIKLKGVLARSTSGEIGALYHGWWMAKTGDLVWSLELAECSGVVMASEDLLARAADETGLGRDLWDGVLEEGRKNLVELLERGGHEKLN